MIKISKDFYQMQIKMEMQPKKRSFLEYISAA